MPTSPFTRLAFDLLPVAVAPGFDVAAGVKSAGQDAKVFDAVAVVPASPVAVAFPIAAEAVLSE